MKKGAKRLLAVALAILMTFGVLSAASFAFDPQTEEGGTTLTIKTKIFREVPAGSGNWQETDKVRQDEPVKARVYLGTDYWTNGGNLIFFYDKSFFLDAFDPDSNTLKVNPYYANSANGGVTGYFIGANSTSTVMNNLKTQGVIDDAFIASHNFAYLGYTLGTGCKNIQFDISKWFCEFDLTVSPDAPSAGGNTGYFGSTKGAFFTLTEAVRTPENQNGVNNVPKGPQNGDVYGDLYPMSLWNATIENDDPSEDPDRSGPFPVELYTNFVTADFNPNGGRFSGGYDPLHFEGEAGDPIDVETPTKGSQAFEGWRASGSSDEPAAVTALPAADTVYEAVWHASESDGQLQFRTEFYRLDPVTNDWVYTEKVKRGETVKARVYITTDYFTTSPDLLFFYDNDFFIDSFPLNAATNFTATSPDGIANVNRFTGSSAADTQVEGKYLKITDPYNRLYTDRAEGLVTPNGYIQEIFAQRHTAITAGLRFAPDLAKKLYGGVHVNGAADQPDKDQWFVEFELQVRPDAGQLEEDHGSQPHDYDADFDKYWGRFFVKGDDGTQPGTIADPDERPYGYVNVPYNADAAGTSENSLGMWLKKINAETVDYPVCVVGSLTLHGGEHQAELPCPHPGNGTFNSIPAGDDNRVITHPEDNTQYTVSGYIGDPITPDLIVEPEFLNHVFLGWAPYYDPDNPTQILADPTEEDIVELPTVMPYEDAEYQAVWADAVQVIYHPENGEDVITIDDAPVGLPVDTEEVPYIVPPGADPEKEGYTFVGWNNTSNPDDYTGVGDLPVTYPNEDTEYYAHYVAIPYSVTYYIIDPDTHMPRPLGAISLNVNNVIPRTPPTGFESQIPDGYTLVPDNVDPDPYRDAGFTVPLEEGATMPAASVDVYYKIDTIKDIEADFDPAEGHFPSLNPDQHEHIIVPTDFGDLINAPAEDPVQDGYHFIGWTPDVGYMDDEEGKTFVAAYAPNEYITSYESVEGEIYDEIPGLYGDDFDSPADPDKEGYNFEGWALEDPEHPYTPANPPAIDDIDEFPPTVPLGDQTYIAVFTPVDCPLTFDPNGGTFANPTTTGTVSHGGEDFVMTDPISLNVPYDSNIDPVKPVPNPTRQGYDFAGWSIDGVNAVYPLGIMDDVNGKTFYALWTKKGDTKYTVNVYIMKTDGTYPTAPNHTLELSGATGQHVTYTPVLPDPNVFYVDAAAPDPVSNLEGDILADGSLVLNVYIGREGPVNVTFYANSDGGDDADLGKFADDDTTNKEQTDLYYDADIAVPADPVREGYTFIGWSTLPNGTASTTIPAKVPNLPPDPSTGPLDPAAELEYYAIWEANQHTIIFDANGGAFTGPMAIVTITENYGTDIVAQRPDNPEREGYTFTGYYKIDPATNLPDTTVLYPHDENLPATMPDEDQRYQAQWVLSEWSLTFDPNGGTFDDPTTTGGVTHTGEEFIKTDPIILDVEYNDDLDDYKPEPNPSKAGYTFAGWSTNSSATAPDADLGTMPAENVTFYAVWTPSTNNRYWLGYYHMKPDGEYAEQPDLMAETTPYQPIADDDGNFNIGGGNLVEVTPATTGTLVTAYIAPADARYEPDYEHPGFKSQDIVAADGNTALKVFYKLKQYTLTVIVDSEITHTSYLVGAPVTAPTTPTKPGYDFAGWTFAPNTYTAAPATMPAEDVTMTATWEVHKWTVTYYKDANDVTEPVDVHETFAEVPYGGAIPGTTVPAAPAGMYFAGWEAFDDDPGEDGLPARDLDGESPAEILTMPDRDLKFRAVWSQTQTYPITIEYYTQNLPPHTGEPTDRTNYTLYLTTTMYAEDGAEITPSTTPPSGFIYNPYPANPNNPNPSPPEHPIIVHPATATTPIIIEIFFDRATGPIPPGTGNGYPLRIHDQYGGVVNTIYYYYGETIVLPETPAEKMLKLDEPLGSPHDPVVPESVTARWVGHRLVGFDKVGIDYTDPELSPLSGTLNPNGFDYTTMPAFTDLDNPIGLDAYSVWEVCEYDLIYDAGEGTFPTSGESTESQDVPYGTENPDPTEPPVRPGYTFVGWDDAETDEVENLIPTGNLEDEIFGTMDEDGDTFNAVWEQNEYYVEFHDYEFHEDPPEERIPCVANRLPSPTSTLHVTYEEIIDPFPDPAFGHPEYVTFLGWSTVEFDRDHIVDPETASIETLAPGLANDGTLYLYAVYERVEILLVPKDDSCTTVIERRFGDPANPTYTYNAEHYEVQDAVFKNGIDEHCWYVYGLEEYVYDDQQASSSFPKLSDFIKVKGDGHYEVTIIEAEQIPFGSAGTGAIIRVYDNVTNAEVEFFRIIVYGDVNGDAVVNAADSKVMLIDVALPKWSNPDNVNPSTNVEDINDDYYTAYKLKAADLNITAPNPADPNDCRDREIHSADVTIVEDHMLYGHAKIDQATGTCAA